MTDFTSALYLGMTHGSAGLPEWSRLTTGRPAALEEIEGTAQAESELARITGCERVVLGRSTLHLMCDLFAMLQRDGVRIEVTPGAYPISRLALGCNCSARARRALVTDGYDPFAGQFAPLRYFTAQGLTILDDTQALGIFGPQGGGSLRAFGLGCDRVLLVSSLAKAFGAPVAMLGGTEDAVSRFRARSVTRVHCSGPSAVDVAAAVQALRLNRICGDVLRSRLIERVRRLRDGLEQMGMAGTRGLFPVQTVRLPGDLDALAVHQALLEKGIRTVARRGLHGAEITFVVTAKHRIEEIDRALECLTGFSKHPGDDTSDKPGVQRRHNTGEHYERASQVS